MRKNVTERLLATALTAGLVLGAAGCGKASAADKKDEAAADTVAEVTTDEDSEETSEDATSDDGQVEKIVAAVMGTTTFYASVDDSGELVGYNVDVLNAVFDNLPQYDLEFELTEFQSIFSGIDTDQYQIGAQAFISNPERREKYIFSESFGKYVFKLAVNANNTDINSWKDIGGKVTEDIVGNGPVAIVEAYNEQFPDNPATLNYVDDSHIVIQHIADGSVDFEIASSFATEKRAEEYGIADKIKFVDFGDDAPDYFNANQYFGFIFSKNRPELAEAFNTELEKLIEDGTIDQLNEKWFGSTEYGVTIEEARDFRDSDV